MIDELYKLHLKWQVSNVEREAIIAFSLILWASATSFVKSGFEVFLGVHNPWSCKACFFKKAPNKTAILPVNSLLGALWCSEGLHVPRLSGPDTEQGLRLQHLTRCLQDLELRGLCLDNFWEIQILYRDYPKLRPSCLTCLVPISFHLIKIIKFC